jgi:predicted Zn finger-like uncharacterized protein
VIVTCPSCGARYQYDDSRFGESSVKRLRCSKCDTIYEVHRDSGESEVLQSTAARAASTSDDTTRDLELRRVKRHEDEELPELAPLTGNRRYALAVILGANSGQIYAITSPRVYLGRGTDVDVQLPDSEVSRRHAMLEIHDDNATLTDLGSTNGTFVEGVRIERQAIASHEEFSLGTTTLMFIVTEVHEG